MFSTELHVAKPAEEFLVDLGPRYARGPLCSLLAISDLQLDIPRYVLVSSFRYYLTYFVLFVANTNLGSDDDSNNGFQC
jgi:hypothetical protein